MKHPTNKLLFFGSFNPIHMGHIQMVSFSQKKLNIKETLFIISPQNPFKKKKDILDFETRLVLLEEGKKDFPFINPSIIEKNMSLPNYTYKTIERLKDLYLETNFFLLIGTDNWNTLHLWKNYKYILENTTIVVYPRLFADFSNRNINPKEHKIIFLEDAPLVNISATEIRKRLNKKENTLDLLPPSVYLKIQEKNIY